MSGTDFPLNVLSKSTIMGNHALSCVRLYQIGVALHTQIVVWGHLHSSKTPTLLPPGWPFFTRPRVTFVTFTYPSLCGRETMDMTLPYTPYLARCRAFTSTHATGVGKLSCHLPFPLLFNITTYAAVRPTFDLL